MDAIGADSAYEPEDDDEGDDEGDEANVEENDPAASQLEVSPQVFVSNNDTHVFYQLRTERLRSYILFLERFMPSVGWTRPEGDEPKFDTDLESARNLALIAAFNAIRAEAMIDTHSANCRMQETTDGGEVDTGRQDQAGP